LNDQLLACKQRNFSPIIGSDQVNLLRGADLDRLGTATGRQDEYSRQDCWKKSVTDHDILLFLFDLIILTSGGRKSSSAETKDFLP
jgi:hypothetical protein